MTTDKGSWPAGTFLVTPRAGADQRIKAQAKQLGLTVASVAAMPTGTVALSGLPRVGLYHGYPGNSDEGWTRYVFDTFKVPYKQLHDDEVRAGNLKDSYDTIILPDASYSSMLNGARAGSLPAKYTGGMTQAGVDNLKAFVQAGGTLVAINDATQLPIRAFSGLPADRRHRGRPEHRLLLARLDPGGRGRQQEPADVGHGRHRRPVLRRQPGVLGRPRARRASPRRSPTRRPTSCAAAGCWVRT